MRAPERQRHRPRDRKICPAPAGTDLQALAEKATYTGSPIHKDAPSPAGPPQPQPDKGICPRSLGTDCFVTVTDWLRRAILSGNVGAPWENGFPRYAWHKEGDTVYAARLTNCGPGVYKGCPLEPRQWPRGLR